MGNSAVSASSATFFLYATFSVSYMISLGFTRTEALAMVYVLPYFWLLDQKSWGLAVLTGSRVAGRIAAQASSAIRPSSAATALPRTSARSTSASTWTAQPSRPP